MHAVVKELKSEKKLTSVTFSLPQGIFFLEYVVQYYLYERKDDGDKIFVCNHT